MPELPEVETTRRGIAPHIQGRRIDALTVRQRRLRWPVAAGLERRLAGRRIESVGRRAKYLLLTTDAGTLLIHLGMSGSLRILPADSPPGPHDHFDLRFGDRLLRFHDPRRFGALLWTTQPPGEHRLLRHLGPEPLSDRFDGAWLRRAAAGRRVAVKSLIMDGRVVVGVGNIYASEALYRAGIHPQRPAGRIAAHRCQRLADGIKQVLEEAIRQGGTTLRDFHSSDGRPGYFAQRLQVYDREGEPCRRCAAPIRQRRIAQRSSFYCPRCQR